MGTVTIQTKWFEFHQNNSGGSYKIDESAGIGHTVWIEGLDAPHACARAEHIGLYFDGAGDCPCCGNRWHRPWSDDGQDEPCTEYFGKIRKALDSESSKDLIFVHPIEGEFYRGVAEQQP